VRLRWSSGDADEIDAQRLGERFHAALFRAAWFLDRL